MIQVDHYGLHFDGAVPWLLQGRGGSNFVGLNKKTPFFTKGTMCNHLIPLAAPVPDRVHWEFFQSIARDPLVKAMLPIPHLPEDRAFFFEDPYDDLILYLSCLSRFSSPIKPIVKPAWMVKETDIEFEMSRTNVQPWVITKIGPKNQGMVTKIAEASLILPRTVILTGHPDVIVTSPMKRCETSIRDIHLDDLISKPIENLGATVLRRFARKEVIDGDIESRQDRRDRMIGERERQ